MLSAPMLSILNSALRSAVIAAFIQPLKGGEYYEQKRVQDMQESETIV
jgi:hypothetical protein